MSRFRTDPPRAATAQACRMAGSVIRPSPAPVSPAPASPVPVSPPGSAEEFDKMMRFGPVVDLVAPLLTGTLPTTR